MLAKVVSSRGDGCSVDLTTLSLTSALQLPAYSVVVADQKDRWREKFRLAAPTVEALLLAEFVAELAGVLSIKVCDENHGAAYTRGLVTTASMLVSGVTMYKLVQAAGSGNHSKSLPNLLYYTLMDALIGALVLSEDAANGGHLSFFVASAVLHPLIEWVSSLSSDKFGTTTTRQALHKGLHSAALWVLATDSHFPEVAVGLGAVSIAGVVAGAELARQGSLFRFVISKTSSRYVAPFFDTASLALLLHYVIDSRTSENDRFTSMLAPASVFLTWAVEVAKCRLHCLASDGLIGQHTANALITMFSPLPMIFMCFASGNLPASIAVGLLINLANGILRYVSGDIAVRDRQDQVTQVTIL